MKKYGFRPEGKILDIGCGYCKYPESTGVDIAPLKGVDVVTDLNKSPYPFEDNTFDWAIAHNIIEHLNSIVLFMEETWRILKPNGLLEIRTPHYSSWDSWRDPTHIWHLVAESFRYFLPGDSKAYYSKAKFEIVYRYIPVNSLGRIFIMQYLINKSLRSLRFWESHLSFIMRNKTMIFVLKRVK